MKLVRLCLFLSYLLASCIGCSVGSSQATPYGPCDYNADCRDGDRCINKWCEDIYNPERKIHQR